jgi:O-antigen/teichoic acid export membrane protein
VARGAFWSIVGTLGSRGLGLLSSIFIARLLGKSVFGELGVIQSTIAMLSTFAGFGLGMTATKFIAEYRNSDKVKAGRVLAISNSFVWLTSGMTAVALFCFAPWLALNTLAAPNLAGPLRIAALFLLFSTINAAQNGVLAGFEAFKKMTKMNLIGGLANFPCMILGAYWAGLTGAVWGLAIAASINWLLSHLAIRKECARANIPYSFDGCWSEKKILWTFSLPAFVSGVFIAPVEWALNASLANQPGGYAQMGLYSAAKQWHTLILYLPLTISVSALPILSNLISEGKKEQFVKMLVTNTSLLVGCALLVAVPVAVFSKFIMGLYGPDFASGGAILVLISIYSVLHASHIIVGQAMWSMGATVDAMVMALFKNAVLVGFWVALMQYKALGLAAAFLLTSVVQSIYLIPYVRYLLNKRRVFEKYDTASLA